MTNDIAAGMHGKALMSSNMAAKRRTTFILRNYRHSCQNRGYGQSLNAFLRVGCNECKNLHLQIICTSFRFLYFSFFSPTVALYTNDQSLHLFHILFNFYSSLYLNLSIIQTNFNFDLFFRLCMNSSFNVSSFHSIESIYA